MGRKWTDEEKKAFGERAIERHRRKREERIREEAQVRAAAEARAAQARASNIKAYQKPTAWATPIPLLDGARVGLSVKFDVTELRGWPSENIKAFMNGIAEALAAEAPQVNE